MARSAFLYSDRFLQYRFSSRHPLQQVRLQMNKRLAESYALFTTGDVELVEPAPATVDDLLLVHTPEYVDVLRRLSAGDSIRHMGTYGFGPGDNPPFPGMYDATLLYVGATKECVRRVLDGDNVNAFNNSGGLHHALAGQAAGFCLANDCALAARWICATGRRVAYIDIDAHHGDGVQSIFYRDPDVLTVSIHETPETLFPRVTGFVDEIGDGPGIGYNINIPMLALSTDDQYEYAFNEIVTPVLERFNPDIIILQVGADGHWQDKLAHLALTSHGWLRMVKTVLSYGKPVVALGGGGYNIKTVARLWTLLLAELSGVPISDRVPEPLASEYDIQALHDTSLPTLTDDDRSMAWRTVRANVDAVRELVFPYLGLF